MIRSALRPPRRRAAAIVVASSAGLVTIGVLIGMVAEERSRIVIPISTPVFIDPPKVPAPVVTVHVPPPPEPPAPPPPPPPPPAPRPRALAPYLDPACIAPLPEGASPLPACAWDEGFPAISPDGTLLAQKVYDGEPPQNDEGPLGVAIAFIDVKTWRMVRREILISAKGDLDREGKLRPGIEARIGRRVAAAQRALDEGGFRSLVWLGSNQSGTQADDKRIHAEFDDGAVRIVDPARSVVLWRHRFVPSIKPRPFDEARMCGGLGLQHAGMWWDPPTGTVLAELSYQTGGCMCPHEGETQLHHIPAAALAGR